MAAAFGKRAAPAIETFARPAKAAPIAAMAVPQPAIAAPVLRIPVATIAIVALLGLVFAAEVRFAPVLLGGMSPPVGALIAYGAVDGTLVFHAGEWWRIFTAPLLHANLTHLLSNVAVFAIVGFMLEPLIGARWFIALYGAGAIGGSLCSLALDPGDIPCVGASAAIMGVLGGAFLCGASHKAGPKGRKMQSWALRLILPALIPMAADSHVDYAGHLGGVVAGLVLGVALQMVWTKGEDRPALGEAAAGMGLAVFAAGVLSLLLFAPFGHAAEIAAASAPGMIPDAQLPRDDHAAEAISSDLVARYPHDPRAHLYRGIAFLTAGHDLADAEEQFRRAIEPADLAAAGLDPAFAKTVTVLLSLTIAYEGRAEEARAMGGPLCGFARDTMSDEYDTMQTKGICPGG